VGGLSFAIGLAAVVASGRLPHYVATGPFANLHGGLPTGLPAYPRQLPGSGGAGQSEGGFEWTGETADSADEILSYYSRSIDHTIWDVTAVGTQTISFYKRDAPGIRGGVRTLGLETKTFFEIWVTDMKLPAGYPVDFPAGHRARPIGTVAKVADAYVVRWDVDGNASPAAFVKTFATSLTDAGWDVLTLDTSMATPSLTCRRRSLPALTCSVTVTYEVDLQAKHDPVYPAPGRLVATVRIGPEAQR